MGDPARRAEGSPRGRSRRAQLLLRGLGSGLGVVLALGAVTACSEDKPEPVDHAHEHTHGDEEAPGPLTAAPPSTGAAVNKDAKTMATEAMKAFAQPKADYDTWWAGLSPYLSAAAQQAYSYTDPANVPASKVTGPAKLGPSESDYLSYVEVPTDVGTYTVLLSRSETSGWVVERLTPPADLS